MIELRVDGLCGSMDPLNFFAVTCEGGISSCRNGLRFVKSTQGVFQVLCRRQPALFSSRSLANSR